MSPQKAIGFASVKRLKVSPLEKATLNFGYTPKKRISGKVIVNE